MKVSKGWQDATVYYAIRSSAHHIMFLSGAPLTSEELKGLESRTPGNIYSGNGIYINLALSALSTLGRELLADLNFNRGQGYTWTQDNKQVFTLEMSDLPTKVNHVADGVIGNIVIQNSVMSSPSTSHTSNYSLGMLFLSVGLPGSGADVELTQLNYAQGDDIRMNNLEIVVNI